MAEGIVASLMVKLGVALATQAATFGGSCIAHEVTALRRLFSEMEEIKDELECMQTFLQVSERLRDHDETMATFVRKVRTLSFGIEDVVDEFSCKFCDDHGGAASRAIRKLRRIRTWHRLAFRLVRIKASLKIAVERVKMFNTEGISKVQQPQAQDKKLGPSESAGLVTADCPVGIEHNRDLLIGWLTDEIQQNMVISVWGMGGVGKTTLVTHVYNIIKPRFERHAFITVSQHCRSVDLLRQILKKFCKKDHNVTLSEGIDSMDRESLVEIMQSYLHSRRYVLVLDDLWDANVWFEIRDAFAGGDGSSKIVLTSRIHDVASLAKDKYIIDLRPLESQHSWDLFCKEAFWKMEDKSCPRELEASGQKIVESCDGLPIAIVCIGRLLSFRSQTSYEWEKVQKDIELQLTSNSILDMNLILKVSLEDLSHNLKNCFLFCSLFPEVYRIRRKKLIRFWVSEGFIKRTETRTEEEIAEDYLNELVNRCLLQVTKRNEFGRVRECRMHDVVRVLALSKSKEEMFSAVYDCSKTTSLLGKARRMSIQSADSTLSSHEMTHVRSLLVFDKCVPIDALSASLTSLKLLSVLDLHGIPIKSIPVQVFSLFNLRFLGLRGTEIDVLPKEIKKLQNLEVLDAYNTKITSLPEEMTRLRKLRHLFASGIRDDTDSNVVVSTGVAAPRGKWHSTSLQTLQNFKANDEMLQSIACLSELRTLGITDIRSGQSASLCSAISKLSKLQHLLVSPKGDEALQLSSVQLPQTIQKLEVGGLLGQATAHNLFTSIRYLENITHLHLWFSMINQDLFRYLQSDCLLSLCILQAFQGEDRSFSAGSFPKLQSLVVHGASQLSRIEIEEGSMVNLVRLTVTGCPTLKELPQGVEFLHKLETLQLEITVDDFLEKIQSEE
ncbi:disease resistance protein RPM1-like [Triticum dicoccoides]|uniref:disease resistance protein RPM1-like n=1 Tax=Triticum dicoccoides TaxID=85692 RepID=UPI00188E2E24|nr:disease resistance protein RPM1-like [Triticum dicoccoides]